MSGPTDLTDLVWRQVLPLWLVLLVGVPLLVGAVVAAVRAGRTGWGWWRRAALVAVVGVVALTPAVTITQAVTASGPTVELYFVVDRTGSMAAEDWGPGPDLPRPPGTEPVTSTRRLDGARIDVVQLADAVPGAGYAVIGFASDAGTQLPLTTDASAVTAWAATVTQEVTAGSTGSSLSRPVDLLTRVLTTAQERAPHAQRYVYVLSDGEQTDDEPAQSWAPVAELVDGGAVLGYGTQEGATMRSFDGSDDPDAPYILDDAQEGSPPAVSRIDEDALRVVAAELGVPYEHRTTADAVDDLVTGIEPGGAAGDDEVTTTRDVVWPFALAAAGLLAAEAFAWSRAAPALRLRRGKGSR